VFSIVIQADCSLFVSVFIATSISSSSRIRDQAMIEYDRLYPGWGFAEHKGYATPSHRAAIRRLGPSPIHRTSWAPFRVSELAGLQS